MTTLQWSTADSNAMLRRLVSEQRAEIADLMAERDLLRATLLGEATVADAESEPADRKGADWWMAACREVIRHRSELLARVQKLDRWLLQSGQEATRLQAELDRSREQNGGLARQIAETEGDVIEANALLAEALDKLAGCECGGTAGVH